MATEIDSHPAPDEDGALLVTGAAGFIGSSFVAAARRRFPDRPIVSLDALTYAADRDHLRAFDADPRHAFVQVDVTDREAVRAAFRAHRPSAVVHLAAESHVDRSILDPTTFVRTNVEGTAVLLQEAHRAWEGRRDVRFLHVSTDEVFGSAPPGEYFRETTPYGPNSPYAASKAAADHLASAWHRTYGLPVVVTNCSNNYGPRQFPEKLIPVVVSRALADEPVPVYGRGANIRDWIHVDDHCQGLLQALTLGRPGRSYCFGGGNERTNLGLVEALLDAVDRHRGTPGRARRLVTFVADRPGHDLRYAIDDTRARAELAWAPAVDFDRGLLDTVAWYVQNVDWMERMRARQRDFEDRWYGRSAAR
jgi:dTDP-glucose 4,6-dehydratase